MWAGAHGLPDAHVEAPTAGSVILGRAAQDGRYGFIRFAMPMFPNAAAQARPWIAWIGSWASSMAAVVAMVQPT